MRELLQSFLNRSASHASNIIYIQLYEHDNLRESYLRFSTRTRLNIWSIAKVFVVMAAGIAESEGLISLNEYIYPEFEQYFPKQACENLYHITIRHLLTMTSGISDPLFFCDGKERYHEKDWISYFFQKGDFRYFPGTWFCYSNFNTYILSSLIENRSGANLLEYTRYRLFDKIGITNPDWTNCPLGHCMAANGLYVTIDELASFCHMILHHGVFNGVSVVPQDFVIDACRKQFDTTEAAEIMKDPYEKYGYGYTIRLTSAPGRIFLGGNYGQYCVIDFKNHAVACVMSLDGNNHKKIRNDLLDAFDDYYGSGK